MNNMEPIMARKPGFMLTKKDIKKEMDLDKAKAKTLKELRETIEDTWLGSKYHKELEAKFKKRSKKLFEEEKEALEREMQFLKEQIDKCTTVRGVDIEKHNYIDNCLTRTDYISIGGC